MSMHSWITLACSVTFCISAAISILGMIGRQEKVLDDDMLDSWRRAVVVMFVSGIALVLCILN